MHVFQQDAGCLHPVLWFLMPSSACVLFPAAWPSAELGVETEEHFPCYVYVRDAWGKEVQQLPEAAVKLLYGVII